MSFTDLKEYTGIDFTYVNKRFLRTKRYRERDIYGLFPMIDVAHFERFRNTCISTASYEMLLKNVYKNEVLETLDRNLEDDEKQTFHDMLIKHYSKLFGFDLRIRKVIYMIDMRKKLKNSCYIIERVPEAIEDAKKILSKIEDSDDYKKLLESVTEK